MISDTVYRLLKASPGLRRTCRRVVTHLPHRQRQVAHFGNKLWIDPSELHGFYLYYEHEYDDWLFEFLAKRLSSYSCALDIGANIGIYTVFLASGIMRIDAFEPDQSVLPRLRSNLALNNLQNVVIHEMCIAKDTGNVTFASSSPHNRGLGHVTLDIKNGASVNAQSLDDFFGGPVRVPTLLKIDIEGGEWLAMQGCKVSIGGRLAPVDMLVEVHPEMIRSLGGTSTELKRILESFALTVNAITPGGLCPPEPAEDHRFWWVSDNSKWRSQSR